jgi:large subunit ribosomal protein L3
MAGRMGADRVTLKRVTVVKVDVEKNLVFLRGAVPGARNALVRLLKG